VKSVQNEGIRNFRKGKNLGSLVTELIIQVKRGTRILAEE